MTHEPLATRPTGQAVRVEAEPTPLVSGHRGGEGANLAKWEVKPTMLTSQCGRQPSWLTSSPDHLVRLEEHGRGHRKAEGLGGL